MSGLYRAGGSLESFSISTVAIAAAAGLSMLVWDGLSLLPKFSAYSPQVANYATTIGIKEINELYGKGKVDITVSIGDGDGVGSHMTKTVKCTDQAWEERYYRYDHSGIDTSMISVDKWEPKQNDESGQRGSRTLHRMNLVFLDWCKKPDVRLKFRNCAEKLVQKRRLRTLDTVKWERYALASKFLCPSPDCGKEQFLYRDNFEHHLKDFHNTSSQEAINQIVNFGRLPLKRLLKQPEK